MKKIVIALAMTVFMIGCGDETTIKGYTDEDVQNIFSIFKDSVVQEITDSVIQASKDTVCKVSKDTIVKASIDTIYKNSKDTIYLADKDTIYSVTTKDSVVYIYKTDTIYNAVNDTSLIQIIDSIYHNLETSIDEIPRDTSITLYDTTETDAGYTIVSKKWKGKVYKGVFYDTTAYTAFHKDDYAFPDAIYSSTLSSDSYYCWHQCGAIVDPDFWEYPGCWKTISSLKRRYDGWRIFNFSDVLALQSNIVSIIGENSVYFARAKYYSGTHYSFYYNHINASGEIIPLDNATYLCVYDLADE